MKIDLHSHSTYSDGQYNPCQLMQLAKKQEISLLSLTDHDTIAGCCEAINLGQQLGIIVIPGVEFSADNNKELHILGYNIDLKNVELEKMCKSFKELRSKRNQKIFDYLDSQGIHLNKQQVMKFAKNGLVGRPHFARAMLEAGYITDLSQAFDRYLATPEFDKIERPKPTAQIIINLIHNSGGIAVLAHPISLKLTNEKLEEIFSNLCNLGLDGIECYYSAHTSEQTQFYLYLAQKYDKLVTIGSDFHGEKVRPKIQLGNGIEDNLLAVPNEILEVLKNKLCEDVFL